ncbi:MAG: S-methyl-5-thioribose-1-phosphate isomerase [Firmicutes bacterium]|nr:S-methyl-5-thioribose-1-phosphate isomerase [Bacillota bacterium]
MKDMFDFKTVSLSEDGESLVILDQTLLPGEMKYLTLNTEESIWEAIYKLRVRGAPAIGVAAAYGMYVAANSCVTDSVEVFIKELERIKTYLGSARPTAVNLFWALDKVFAAAQAAAEKTGQKPDAVAEIKHAMRKEAERIHEDDIRTCMLIGENCLELLEPGMGILTHCNAGALATAGIGTALAPIYVGNSRGYGFKVFADETRPLLQGARLTAWELSQSGADVTLICDNMASLVMKSGKIRAVITGADRIAANGDTANKIGTSGVAILAKEYGIPVYINAPLSTIDMECRTGAEIRIEERPGEEIYKMWYEKPMSVEGIKTFNPAFDVTDNKYIAAIITEKGIARPPFNESLNNFFK